MTADEIAALMRSNAALRRITVEVVVIEQTRPNGEAPWSKARRIRQVTLWDAAVKTEKTVTEKGDHMMFTAAGTPEEVALFDLAEPKGLPS